jgi:hypothetical protein
MYVTFDHGEVTSDAGDVVTGQQILDTFYNRRDVIDGLASALYAENCLGKFAKKNLRSLGTFSPGSKPPTKSPAGDEPVSIAVPVKPEASVSVVDATVNHGERPSGVAAS